MADEPTVAFEHRNGRLTTRVNAGPLVLTRESPQPTIRARMSMRAPRSALLVAVDGYVDARLQKLAVPANPVAALLGTLRTPDIGNFHAPPTLKNKPASVVAGEIERFFADRTPKDVLLLYLSCVAVHDAAARVFLAMADTRLRSPEAASLDAAFLDEQIRRCRSEKVVVILDCRYTAAFPRDGGPSPGEVVDLQAHFGATGRAILSAAPVLRRSVDASARSEAAQPLVRWVLPGLRKGEADLDGNKLVTVDELFRYVADGVESVAPSETPLVVDPGPGRDLALARSDRSSGKTEVKPRLPKPTQREAAPQAPDAGRAAPQPPAAPPPTPPAQPSPPAGPQWSRQAPPRPPAPPPADWAPSRPPAYGWERPAPESPLRRLMTPLRVTAALSVVLVLVLVVVVLVNVGRSDEAEPAPPVTPERTSAFSMQDGLGPGDCFDEDDAYIFGVPCARPHLGEIVAMLTVPEGPTAPYPGDAEMARRSDRPCQQRFAEFVGVPPERSQYDSSYFNANAKGWAEGNRGIMCVLVDQSRTITGSARGIRR